MSAKRTTSLAAALAAAALSLAACGGSTDTDTSAATTAAATGSTSASAAATDSASASASASDTAAASSSGSETSSSGDTGSGETVDLADAEVGDKVDATKLGAAMAEVFKDGQSGHMTMDMSPIKAEGDFEVKDGKQNSTMTMEMSGQKIEMISIDGVTYMKGLTGGTKWVKTDMSDLGGGSPNLNSFDPATMAKAFGGQQAEVTAKDGDTTTYELELDVKKLFEAMDTDLPTGATMPDSIPVTYVLDGENRPVKSTINMGTNIVVEYSDWGKDVDIQAPPASEVTTG